MANTDFEMAQDLGIRAEYQTAGFMPYAEKDGRIVLDYAKANKQLAQDSALVTNNNIGFPAWMYTYINPEVIEVLFAKMAATKLFSEKKNGEWTDEFVQFNREEIVGDITAYSDFQNGSLSDVNVDYFVRENFRFQTMIRYGDLEVEKAQKAKMQLVARKHNAAAQNIARASNKFYLYGVAGKKIYGALNDPNLAPALAPYSVDGASTWAAKLEKDRDGFANIVYNDIVKMVTKMMEKNGGLVDLNTSMKLAMSNAVQSYLTIPNVYGKTAQQLLKENYPNISIEILPELSSNEGEKLMLVVENYGGMQTGMTSFTDKFFLKRLIPDTSSYYQKAAASTQGCIILRPNFIVTLVGV